MERVEAKLVAWKGLYEELGRVEGQVAAAVQAGEFKRAEDLKNQAARLAIRSDAALHAIHETLKLGRPAAVARRA
jgi:hypothetical protein